MDYATHHGSSTSKEKLLKFFFFSCHDLPLGDTTTVALVDRDMLIRVRNEMDCRMDVCRFTKGGHIEHL